MPTCIVASSGVVNFCLHPKCCCESCVTSLRDTKRKHPDLSCILPVFLQAACTADTSQPCIACIDRGVLFISSLQAGILFIAFDQGLFSYIDGRHRNMFAKLCKGVALDLLLFDSRSGCLLQGK